MSELLNSLNAPDTAAKPWIEEVADAGASEAPQSAPEPVAAPSAPEAPAAENAAPEAPESEPEAHDEPDRRVPLKALQEERAKRAESERQAAEYQRRLAEYEAYLAGMQQQMQPQQEQFQEPDPETDPIGALKYAKEQLRQTQEAIAQQAYERQVQMAAAQAESQFRQAVPDYQDALQYARQSRAQELAAFGTPQHVIGQVLHREEMQLIDQALRANRNPAEVIYTFAKARGFQGKTAAPAPAPAPQPAVNPALQQAKQAVAASAAAGGAPASRGELSVADVAAMNGEHFDSGWNKLFGHKKSSIFRE